MLKNHGTEIKSSLEAIVLNQNFQMLWKVIKINIIPTKDFLADTHIVIFICEISNFKIKWKEFVLAAGSFVENPS